VKGNFCNLIVISTASPTVHKLRISRTAIRTFVAAGLVSFLITVSIGQYFSATRVNEVDHARLQSENQALQIENKNAEVRAQRLDSELMRLEELSKRITDLIQTE
jgi:hypothetical protein